MHSISICTEKRNFRADKFLLEVIFKSKRQIERRSSALSFFFAFFGFPVSQFLSSLVARMQIFLNKYANIRTLVDDAHEEAAEVQKKKYKFEEAKQHEQASQYALQLELKTHEPSLEDNSLSLLIGEQTIIMQALEENGLLSSSFFDWKAKHQRSICEFTRVETALSQSDMKIKDYQQQADAMEAQITAFIEAVSSLAAAAKILPSPDSISISDTHPPLNTPSSSYPSTPSTPSFRFASEETQDTNYFSMFPDSPVDRAFA